MTGDEQDPKEPAGRGRFIDSEMALLMGEAARQKTPEKPTEAPARPPTVIPSRFPSMPEGPTYFGQPVLQPPVWVWSVPAYFYVGGTAGAALVLGSAAQAMDGRALSGLVRRCRWIGAAGIFLGTSLLVYDLGKPARFLNMLRVFRPTSPLSVGSWLLAVAGPLAGASAVLDGRGGLLGRLGGAASHLCGLLGMPLAGYTGVVLAYTAVPVWQDARRSIPALFTASAMAGTASLLQLMDLGWREHRVVRRFGLIGQAAELAGAFVVDRETSRVPRVGEPLRKGFPGLLWNAAKVLSAASLLISLAPGVSRRKRILAGSLGAAGALCLRFGIMEAGKRSAADPRATFEHQRMGYGAAEVTGVAAVTGPREERALLPRALERVPGEAPASERVMRAGGSTGLSGGPPSPEDPERQGNTW